MCDTHATSSCHIKSSQFAAFVNDGDKTDVVGEDVNVIDWWHCNSNFILRAKKGGKQVNEREDIGEEEGTCLPRKVERPIKRLEVFERLSSYQFLIQPNFMIGSRLRQEVFTNALGERIHLSMQAR